MEGVKNYVGKNGVFVIPLVVKCIFFMHVKSFHVIEMWAIFNTTVGLQQSQPQHCTTLNGGYL